MRCQVGNEIYKRKDQDDFSAGDMNLEVIRI